MIGQRARFSRALMALALLIAAISCSAMLTKRMTELTMGVETTKLGKGEGFFDTSTKTHVQRGHDGQLQVERLDDADGLIVVSQPHNAAFDSADGIVRHQGRFLLPPGSRILFHSPEDFVNFDTPQHFNGPHHFYGVGPKLYGPTSPFFPPHSHPQPAEGPAEEGLTWSLYENGGHIAPSSGVDIP